MGAAPSHESPTEAWVARRRTREGAVTQSAATVVPQLAPNMETQVDGSVDVHEESARLVQYEE